MEEEKRELLVKKLLYKSCYRGCKETDLVVGEFARQNIAKMSDAELDQFAKVLELSDADIYDWYTAKKPIPKEYKSEIIQKLMKFQLSK